MDRDKKELTSEIKRKKKTRPAVPSRKLISSPERRPILELVGSPVSSKSVVKTNLFGKPSGSDADSSDSEASVRSSTNHLSE